MKKNMLFAVLTAAASLTGCKTAPVLSELKPAAHQPPAATEQLAVVAEPQPAPRVMHDEFQKVCADIVLAGGLAAVGTGESKSLELALNKAKIDGRKELAEILTGKVETLARAFAEEAGIPTDSLLLSGFNDSARAITKQQIAGRVAQTLKYETTGDTFTAYALMEIDPKVIADQLAKEKSLFARLHPTKAFQEFCKDIKGYQAFKAAQQ